MNRQNWKAKAQRSLAILVTVGILSSLLAGSLVMADEPASPSPQGWGEEGIKEVGVAWINDFPGTVNDRSHWDESCDRFYNKLRDAGWTGRFRYTNWGAEEEDYKDESRGGREDSVLDRADIAMICTHGARSWDSFWSLNLSSVYFGTSVDDHHLVPGDGYQAYGDQDLEWLAFDSCSVLGDGGPAPYRDRGYWAATMDGLHLLLGFRNTMYVISTGDGSYWAKYMLGWRMWFPFVGYIWLRSPYKVAQAWFEATDDLQPGSVCARVIAEENVYFNDYLHGRGGPAAGDSDDGDYYYRDHCSCTPPARQISGEVLAQIETMPVYEVVDRNVDEQYTLEIAAAFGISGTIGSDGEFFYVMSNGGEANVLSNTQVETSTLQVDMTTGGYKFRKVSDLFASPDEAPALPTEAEALGITDRFFAGSGQSLPGAPYHTGDTLTAIEEVIGMQQITTDAGILQEEEISRVPVVSMVSYGRVLSGTVDTLGGGVAQHTFSVVGPGAREKAYLGDLGEILGVQGGSRDVQTTGEQVTIMDADRAWDLYIADPSIALAQIPWVADQISKTAETLGYYEYPHAQGQTELIPAWVFTADFYNEGVLLAEGVFVYVPASAAYLPPDISIDSPEEGDVLQSGVLVNLTGSVLQYGRAPFTYEWSSSRSGPLGTGADLTVALMPAIQDNEVVNQTISLEVTDANGQRGVASIAVVVQPTIYLPGIVKT